VQQDVRFSRQNLLAVKPVKVEKTPSRMESTAFLDLIAMDTSAAARRQAKSLNCASASSRL